jgi:hypothetical protein
MTLTPGNGGGGVKSLCYSEAAVAAASTILNAYVRPLVEIADSEP